MFSQPPFSDRRFSVAPVSQPKILGDPSKYLQAPYPASLMTFCHPKFMLHLLLGCKAEFHKTKDTILCKTKRFYSLKNRFHTSNAANHNVLLALFVCYEFILTGNTKFILQRGELLCLLGKQNVFYKISRCPSLAMKDQRNRI